MKYNKFFIFNKKKYVVRNDIEAFSFFYLYFLFRPKFKVHIVKKIFFVFDRLILTTLKLFFIVKINNFFPTKRLNEKYLIKRNGVGNWPSIIKLYKDDEKYYIVKIFSNQHFFNKEVTFLQKYFINKTSIKFPNYRIIHNNQIQYEFIPIMNLATQIRLGLLNYREIIHIYKKICEFLDLLYKDQIVLIHGDLTPDNIYCFKKDFYIIDYSDSHTYNKDYDKFILLKRLIEDYFGIEKKDEIEKFAMFDKSKIKSFEKHYQQVLDMKHT